MFDVFLSVAVVFFVVSLASFLLLLLLLAVPWPELIAEGSPVLFRLLVSENSQDPLLSGILVRLRTVEGVGSQSWIFPRSVGERQVFGDVVFFSWIIFVAAVA